MEKVGIEFRSKNNERSTQTIDSIAYLTAYRNRLDKLFTLTIQNGVQQQQRDATRRIVAT